MSVERAPPECVGVKRDDDPLMCPSAPPEWPESQLIGVAEGTASQPRIHYTGPQPVTKELLALAAPVTPTEVFRFAARCQQNICRYFDGSRCQLVTAVVDTLPPHQTEGSIPPCGIRSRCRWWREEGVAACRRCSQVVTDNPVLSPELLSSLKTLTG